MSSLPIGQVLCGDCLEVMAGFPAASVDCIVTDPPYGLRFMGKDWDTFKATRNTKSQVVTNLGAGMRLPTLSESQSFQAWCTDWAREALRVLKDGGRLLAFAGARTQHRMVCGIEDAGFTIEDCMMWLYGCLSEDTEILINGQWEPYHKAKIGSLALGYNPSDGTYSWQPISEVFVYPYDDTAYRIHSDRTDQIVSRNHRCLVERGGAFVFQFAEEAARERQAVVPILESLSGLLADLPLPESHAGAQESVLLSSLQTIGDTQTARGDDSLRGLRRADQPRSIPPEAGASAYMLEALQRDNSSAGIGKALRKHAGQGTEGQAVRSGESSLEGRSDLLSEARELQADQVCAMPGGIPANGPQGRLCDGASADSGADNGPLLGEGGGRASCEPRPAGQPAGESGSLSQQSGAQAARGQGYTVTDLARIEPIHYTGNVWCVKVPTGAFVARRNGQIFVTGNSGFPKHKSKLKPAYEPICVARKGKVSLLNIDAARIGTAPGGWNGAPNAGSFGGFSAEPSEPSEPSAGRWPANIILDPESAAMLDEQSGWPPSNAANRRADGGGTGNVYTNPHGARSRDAFPDDSGGASRFFYTGKSSSAERHAGLDKHEIVMLSSPLWVNEGQQVKLWVDMAASLPRVIGAYSTKDGSAWSMMLSGKLLTALFQPGCKCIIETATNLTTRSGILSYLARWSTSACTAVVSNETGLPLSPAEIAALNIQSVTFTSGETGSAPGADHAALPMPLTISASAERGNSHNTVKPLSLMRYLCKLAVPRGNLILDPFAGSGSTLIAAALEGMSYIGIEREAEYCDIARARIAHWSAIARKRTAQQGLPLEAL